MNFLKSASRTSTTTTVPLIQQVPTDYHTDDLLQQNFARYVCGYLMKKCLTIHCCEICEQYAKSYSDLDDSSLYCYMRAYNNSESHFGSLLMPHDNFVYFISKLEILFKSSFEELSVGNNLVNNFIGIFKKVDFLHPCNSFPKEYLLRLYVRIRIFYTLKDINRNFKSTPKQKLIIWRHQ